MMRCKLQFSLPLLTLPFLVSCTGDKGQSARIESTDSLMVLVAEKLICDVEIKNASAEDKWMEKALEGLDREMLIDFIFKGVYDRSLMAYDIFEDKHISAGKIRQMEEDGEFTRDQIGKIQFTEQWMYDTVNHVMTKRVTVMSLGLENFDPDGYLRGYDPLFKVILP